MRPAFGASVAAFLVIAAVGIQARNPCPTHALYSNVVVKVEGGESKRILSPDGRKRLLVRIKVDESKPDGWDTQLLLSADGKRYEEHLPGWGSELAWSPDSRAFFVTQTEGGGGIGVRAYVFYLDTDKLRKLNVARTVVRDYGLPINCGGDLEPNVAAVAWLDQSRRLLLVAEDFPVSLCRCPGIFRGYELSVPENVVVNKFSQAQTKRRFWKLLGCELRGANDKCSPAAPPTAR